MDETVPLLPRFISIQTPFRVIPSVFLGYLYAVKVYISEGFVVPFIC